MTGPGTPARAEALTLVDCLSPSGAAALASAPGMREAVAGTAQGIPAAALGAALEGWNAAFEQILKIPVGAMFKAASLKAFVRGPETDGPGGAAADPGLVALLPFVVESSHHPTIVVSCAGVAVTLRFDLELSLEVSGAELMVEGGRFVGARTGTSKGVAKISYLNLDPPFQIGSPEFDLPGAIGFAQPVAADAASGPGR